VNPSGRTVVTFPFSMDQWYAQEQSQFPGTTLPGNSHPTVAYDEGVFVGYRWFDQTQQSPRYPFGHGLSYTQFAYSNLSLSASQGDGSSLEVSVTVKNVGARAGSEVAQLYVGFPSWAGEPPRQLKGFQKVALEAGASAQLKFQLDERSFSYWDEGTGGWVIPKGAFQILVGSSSRDVRGAQSYTVTGG
jgi:beta-glucosidase